MGDLCLDEFTDHGHCGVLDVHGNVDNDATLQRYADMAVAQAAAGTHFVGTSGMMDGQVAVARTALDAAGYQEVGILGYAPSTRPASTDRFARRLTRRWSETARPTSRTVPGRWPTRSPRFLSTSPREPTWSW